jgi:hypothetical protein
MTMKAVLAQAGGLDHGVERQHLGGADELVDRVARGGDVGTLLQRLGGAAVLGEDVASHLLLVGGGERHLLVNGLGEGVVGVIGAEARDDLLHLAQVAAGLGHDVVHGGANGDDLGLQDLVGAVELGEDALLALAQRRLDGRAGVLGELHGGRVVLRHGDLLGVAQRIRPRASPPRRRGAPP